MGSSSSSSCSGRDDGAWPPPTCCAAAVWQRETASVENDARSLAWAVLNAVEAGAFADAELATRLTNFPAPDNERRLATALVYGTLTWQGLLDHVLSGLGRNPAHLDPPLRTLLRLALFQIIKLDRVPDFAVVDTAVRLAKTHAKGAASGLVNALLRRFLREGGDLRLPPRRNLARHLAVVHSHPEWLVRLWLDELGADETEALLAADNTAAPTVLRVRAGESRQQVSDALRAAGAAAEATRYAPTGLVLAGSADATQLTGYAAGRFSFQGEASQLVAHLLTAAAPARVLDTCAAPGGKATAIAEVLGDSAFVLALDRNRSGLTRLRRESERLRVAARLGVVRADSTALPLARSRRFDAVLVDAPCSGLGTLRQHPEIRWRRQRREVGTLARRQRALLEAVASHVQPGGTLVYATCTLVRAENQDLVQAFLARHREFVLVDARGALPGPAHELVSEEGYLLTMPQRGGLDGFFAALLKRTIDFRMVPA
jgi:16S rRNA (cytosine967-C5)-methyltransferase